MKKLKIFLMMLLVCAGSLVFNSCNEQVKVQFENPSQEPVFVFNGILCFDSWVSFESFKDDYYKKTPQEKKELELRFGYYSLQSKIDELLDELNQFTEQEQLDEFMANNSHLFGFEDDAIRLKYRNQFLNFVSNQGGYYVIANQMFRVFNGENEVYKKAETLKEALLTEEVILKVPFKATLMKSVTTACGDYKSAFCGGDYNTPTDPDRAKRRVNMEMHAMINGSCGCAPIEKYEMYVYVWGEKKTIFGWNPYQTVLTTKDVQCTMLAPEVTDVVNDVSVYTLEEFNSGLKNANSNGEDVYDLENYYQLGEQVQNVNLPDPYFLMVYGEANSRGVTEYCCVIDCGTDY